MSIPDNITALLKQLDVAAQSLSPEQLTAIEKRIHELFTLHLEALGGKLPHDVVDRIFEQLPARDLARVAQVDRGTRAAAKEALDPADASEFRILFGEDVFKKILEKATVLELKRLAQEKIVIGPEDTVFNGLPYRRVAGRDAEGRVRYVYPPRPPIIVACGTNKRNITVSCGSRLFCIEEVNSRLVKISSTNEGVSLATFNALPLEQQLDIVISVVLGRHPTCILNHYPRN